MNLVILVVIVVAVLAFIWFLYNSIIVAKLRVNEALSQIDVQLKRRTDLIPNLVEAVKGYAKHEKQLFEDVTKERANLVSAKSVEEKAKAEGYTKFSYSHPDGSMPDFTKAIRI